MPHAKFLITQDMHVIHEIQRCAMHMIDESDADSPLVRVFSFSSHRQVYARRSTGTDKQT